MNIDKHLKSDKKIIGIVRFDNVRIKNTHNDFLFPPQSILEIDLEDGFRLVDLFSQKDMTDVDYFEVVSTPKTRKVVIFKDEDEEVK